MHANKEIQQEKIIEAGSLFEITKLEKRWTDPRVKLLQSPAKPIFQQNPSSFVVYSW